MFLVDAKQVEQSLTFPHLVNELENAFRQEIVVPQRLHYDVANPNASRETTLLMMPAWQSGEVIGVKLVTVAPENAKKDLPSIQGTYLLFDVDTGSLLATMDAPSLTAKRTAAASALASKLLSRESSSTLLVVGTGTLAPQLIQAHCSVRPITKVLVWGRNQVKAAQVCQMVAHLDIEVQAASDLEQAVGQADIISCATLSQEPLIKGAWLKAGQHLDMIGAYRPDMREMDDDCLLKAKVYVDNTATAIKETGDLAIPLAQGVIDKAHVLADLFALCRQPKTLYRDENDITLFKSVGHALEDLAAAKVVYRFVTSQQ